MTALKIVARPAATGRLTSIAKARGAGDACPAYPTRWGNSAGFSFRQDPSTAAAPAAHANLRT
jgi:hypothetical protein